jgi:tRNA (guanine-N7-)-methyltransferase
MHALDAATFWPAIFGNSRPVEVEIGSGTGTFLLQAALEDRERNFFGIEHSRSHARLVESRLEKHGASNARIIAGDAICILRHLLPPASVAAFHIYFPDPWWKRRHHRRRLFNEDFTHDLARKLAPGGYVHTATDVEEVFVLIRESMRSAGAFVEDEGVRARRRQQTSFERKGLARGAAIREISFRKHAS